MMNPVSNAVSEIQRVIPSQILTEVFGREDYRNWRRTAPVSVDEMIKSKVLRPRVLKDCNLVGGRHVDISLEGLPVYEQGDEDMYAVIYEIPPQRTGNREILSVLSVNYFPFNSTGGVLAAAYGSMSSIAQSDAEGAGQRVMESFGNVPHISSASVELIGYNTVIIRDQMRSTFVYRLRCVVANEENLSNLSVRSYNVLAQACILAVKSHIYNQLTIRIDQGILEQGQPLGQFKAIVDKYEDAEEKYQEYMNKTVRKVLFMNDQISYERFVSIQVNPGL